MQSEHCPQKAKARQLEQRKGHHRSHQGWVTLLVVFCALIGSLLPSTAMALVDGDPPVLYKQYRLNGDAEVTGNTLMIDTCPSVNTVLLNQSSGDINNLPADAQVEGAFLFWAASANAADTSAVLELPGGQSQVVNAQGACHSVTHLGGSYGCKADVTNFVANNPQPGNNYNGVYTVRGVNGQTGLVDNNCNCLDAFCQAKFAGWSIVIVYSSPTERTQRDVFLYDGFRVIDEELNTAGQDQFTISGFDVGSPPEARLSFFALEGDRQLGIPPQDLTPGSAGCPNASCIDSLELNNTPLSDSFNPAGNVYNGTVPGGFAVGVDLDSYDVSSLVASGDTTATVRLISGDGTANNLPSEQHGWGEYVIVNWLLLRLNRLSPNFSTDKTFLDAVPTSVAPGGTVFFTLNVTNDGSQDATNVVVSDVLPPEFEYVAGTTEIDGTPVPDPGGQFPLQNGLSLGNVPRNGDNDRRITFQVRVRPTVLPGTIITDNAQIDATELDNTVTTNDVQIEVIGANINTPTKVDRDLNGAEPAPGDIIEYEVFVSKQGNVAVGGLEFMDDMSPWVQLTDIPTGPFDASGSSLNGGANGTGQVVVTNINIPPMQAGVFIRYRVRILSSAELIAKGVSPADINGLEVENQGSVNAPFLPMALVTDDPSTGASNDPTTFRISTGVDFTGPDTNKLAVDLNGGQLVPGDTVEFSITFSNNGSQPGTINVLDDIPPFLTNVTVTTPRPEVTLAGPPAGANGTGRIFVSNLIVAPGGSEQVRFTAVVDAAAPDGTIIQNTAEMTVIEDAAQNRPLTTTPLEVFNRPLFGDATKTVVNETAPGGFQPGDTVRYTLTFTNSGTQTGNAVTVSDVVDPSLENVTVLNGGTFDAGTNTITWNVGDVAPGDNVTVEFRADIGLAVPNGTVVSNQALITGTNSDVFLTDDPATAPNDDPTNFTIVAEPDFSDATKSFSDENGGDIEPGDTILYTLVFENTGRAVSTNTSITDVVDSAFDTVTPLDGGTFDPGTRTITWNLGNVPINDTRTVRFRATLLPVLPANTTVANQGFASSAEVNNIPTDDPSTAAVDDPTSFTVESNADLSDTTKSVTDQNGGTFQPGDVVLYELTVNNNGNAPVTNGVITDPVDPNLTNITPLDGGVFDGTTITWNLAMQIEPGVPVVVRFEATIDAATADGTVVANQATVDGTGVPAPVLTDDPATPAVDDPTSFTVVREPEFSTSTKTVTDIDGDGEFNPGDTISYTITVNNTGTDDATNLVVTDVLDANLTNIVPGPNGSVSGNTVTWNLPSLPAGSSEVLEVTADIVNPLSDGTVIPNQGSIVSDEVPNPVLTDDPDTPADDDPTEFTVVSRPRFDGATKTFVDSNGGNIEPDDTIEYTLTYTNEGTDAATNVVITDQVDPNLTNVTVLDGGVFNAGNSLITWDFNTVPALASVDPGETVTVRFEADIVNVIPNLTRIDNQGSLVAANVMQPALTDDPSTAQDDDPTGFFVISAADLTGGTKVATPPGPDGYRPGDTVTWTIDVTNTGTDAANNLSVVDTVDPNLTDVVPLDGGTLAGNTITWNAGSLAVGDSLSVRFQADIVSPLPDGTTIPNQGFFSSPDFGSDVPTDDPNTPADDDPTVITVTSAPRYSASTKTAIDLDGDGFFEPGDRVRYEIEVVNDGDAPGANITVTDTVDTSRLTNIVVNNGGTIMGSNISWAIPALNANDTTVVSFEADIQSGLANGTPIANQSQVADADGQLAVTDDPSTMAQDDPTIITVTAEARLSGATKRVDDLNGPPLLGGDNIRYTIEITNEGTEPATGVVVVDQIDPNLTNVQAPDPRATVTPAEVQWAIGSIAPGVTEVLTIEAVVLPGTPDGTAISNQAQIIADGPIQEVTDDPNTPADDDPTVIVINADPELGESTKVVQNITGGQFLAPGDTVEFTITVQNTGFADATDLTVSDQIPANLVNIQPQNGGQIQGNEILWNSATTPDLVAVPPGAFVNLVFQADIAPGTPSGTVISNQASIIDASGQQVQTDDPGSPAVDDPTTITVRYPSLDVFEKTVTDQNGAPVEPGDQLTYTLTLQAGVGEDLPNVTVTDDVDLGVLEVVSVDNGGFFDPNTGTITWNPGTTPQLAAIPAGGLVTLSFTARIENGVEDGTEVANQALFESPDAEPRQSDDPSTPIVDDPTIVIVNAVSGPDFDNAAKTVRDVNGEPLVGGEVLEYRITVPNTGTAPSAQARLFEEIPANTAYVPGSTQLNGLSVGDGPGGAPPIDGLLINGPGQAPGVIAPGEEAEIRFQVRVLEGTPSGTLITNQATVSASGGFNAETDGDPATPADDPTIILVGDGAALRQTTKVGRFEDTNNNGRLDAGELITWTFTISSAGNQPALGVVLEDTIPTNATYEGGSLRLNGAPLTDAQDGDPGQVMGDQVTVALASIEPNESVQIEFSGRALEDDSFVQNQGIVTGMNVPDQLTDDPSRPGPQDPTIVGDGGLFITKEAPIDINGGQPLIGDAVRYVIRLENLGREAESGVLMVDEVPTDLVQVEVESSPPGSQVDQDGNNIFVNEITLQPGTTGTIQIRGVIGGPDLGGTAALGKRFCNIARAVTTTGETSNSEPEGSCLTPSNVPDGFAELSGPVVHDINRDGAAQDDEPRLDQYRLDVVRAGDPDNAVVASVESNADGNYQLMLPVGSYRLRYYNERGVRMGEFPENDEESLVLSNQEQRDQPVLVDPQGIIYDSQTGEPLSGIQVFAFYDDTDPVSPGELVGPVGLPADSNQQGQLTSADGFYRFDFNPLENNSDPNLIRRYRLEISLTNSQTLQFPSIFVPPQPGIIEVGQQPILVVDNAIPDINLEQRYFLRFGLSGASNREGVRNNHIPLDPIQSLISLDKRVDKPSATIGDVVTYKVTVQNRSDRDITFDVTNDPTDAFNGVFIQDEFPPEGAIQFAPDSARATLFEGSEKSSIDVAIDPEGASTGRAILRFGRQFGDQVVGMDLPAGGRIELLYRGIVGIKSKPNRKYKNTATLFGTGNVRLSDSDSADVMVMPDPIFDQGIVFGKVFCDPNGNGFQDAGEGGVFHARVMLDTGYYAMTDAHGKYHFHDVDPGSHQIKIDTASLPVGSSLTSAESLVFYASRGLPTKTNFGVACPENNVVEVTDVQVGDETAREAEEEFRQNYVNVKADLNAWTASVEDDTFDLMRPTLSAQLSGAEDVANVGGLQVALGPAGLSDSFVFNLAIAQGPAPTRWKLTASEFSSGAVVWESRGEGTPPETVEWDGTNEAGDVVVNGDTAYRVSLDVIGEEEEFAQSAPVIFLVTGAAEETINSAVIDSLAGDIFNNRNQPTSRTQEWLEENKELLLNVPDGAELVIEVHTDDELSPFEAFDLTSAQAQELENWLQANLTLPPDARFIARGLDFPFLPNLDEESRLQNKRIEIKHVVQRVAGDDSAVPDLEVKRGARLNDYTVPFTDQTFDVLVPRPSDGLLVIDVRSKDGARAVKAVEVEPPEGEAVDAEVPVVPVTFNPADATMTVGEGSNVFQTSASLSGAELRTAGDVFQMAAGSLQEPAKIAMRVKGDPPVRRWVLEVKNVATDNTVWRVKDDGAVPRVMSWSGATMDGTLLSGLYQARLTVFGQGAARGVSAPVYFAVIEDGEEPPELPTAGGEPVLRVNGRQVQRSQSDMYPFEVAGYTGEAFLLDYTDETGMRVVEPVVLPSGYERRSDRKDAIPSPDGDSQGEDSSKSLPDPDGELPAGASDSDGPADSGDQDDPGAEDAGDGEPVDGTPGDEDQDRGDGDTETDGPDDGSEAGETDGDEESTRISPDVLPKSRARIRAAALESLRLPDGDGYLPLRGVKLGVSEDDRKPRFRMMLAQPADGEGGTPASNGDEADGPVDGSEAEMGDRGGTGVQPGDPTVDSPANGQDTTPVTVDADLRKELQGFGADQLDSALSAEGIIDVASLRKKARAGNLKVSLPPTDMKLPRNDLVVAGVTDPANQILVNGKEAKVKANGTFQTVATLPDGDSMLVIESVDPEGNRGRIEWPVSVEPVQYFLMAFADTAVSSSNMRLDGANNHNSYDTGEGVVLYGQAKLYFKGRVKGSELGTDFFQTYKATAHVDTAKKAEFEEMFSTLIQPEEYYPVYGDSSEEVHDVNARGKLYLLVEADETYLKVANFRADMTGIEYFDYARTFYGFDTAFNKTFADDFDTHARFFVAGDSFLGDGSSRLRHTYDYLRGTGGSLYYLKNEHVIEGSEQVTLVVKDKVTGAVLARVPQTRNVDYTLRYGEGRLLFKSPIPSVADATFLTGSEVTSRSTMDGHPVFVEVGYEYQSDSSAGDTSFGGQLRETMFDNKLSIGVGYVQEGRGGAVGGNDYQLVGTDVSYRHSAGSFVEAEYARSRSFDTFAAMSDDGGLTFGQIQRRDGLDDVGNAYHARGSFELADVLDTERQRILEVGGFYSNAEESFYANRNALERGNEKFGGHALWNITDQHALGVRNDSVRTRVDDLVDPNPESLKTVARYVTRAHYDFKAEDHRAGVEYNYSFSDDFFAVDGFGMHTTAARYDYLGVDGLALGISQEAIVQADDKRLVSSTGERFTTGLHVTWQILDDLAVEAVEKVRWNGENSTRLGLRSKLNDKASAYVQQRFNNRENGRGFTTSTVIGGEQKFFEDNSGRAFGEYQLDGGVYGERNRAVAGLGKKWHIARGVSIDTAYERTQMFGSGNQGDSSRDVISVGFELTRYDWLKASSRFEFRYDQGDLTAPRESPCLSNGILDTPEFCQDKMKGGFDKVQVVTLNNIDWMWTEDLTMLLRYNLAMTENLTLDALEQIDQELSFGFAFRPVDWDVFNMILKYTWLDSQRPLGLEDYTTDRTQKHVVSAVPVFELPWGIQFVHKLAWKRVISDLTSFAESNLPSVVTDTLLYILRLNYRIWRMTDELTLEFGTEYRFLKQFDPESFEHGALLEANVVILDHLRVGVGYNFTSFSDNEFADETEDAHGWFFRLQGTY